jgi:hypothetical protein
MHFYSKCIRMVMIYAGFDRALGPYPRALESWRLPPHQPNRQSRLVQGGSL